MRIIEPRCVDCGRIVTRRPFPLKKTYQHKNFPEAELGDFGPGRARSVNNLPASGKVAQLFSHTRFCGLCYTLFGRKITMTGVNHEQ
ncbi:MAG: hypothetical protein H6667_00230 [Ardenticatenaceae bacterium]|nr:hypothetical protein [Ardenticatenaceae bacterium]